MFQFFMTFIEIDIHLIGRGNAIMPFAKRFRDIKKGFNRSLSRARG